MRTPQVTNCDEIVRRRMDLGLGQSELARTADITPSYLSQIESGRRQGTAKTLKKIADALGCTVADLLVESKAVA